MKRLLRMYITAQLGALATLLIAAFAAFPAGVYAQAGAKAEAGATAQPAAPPTYAGSDKCQVCHEEIYKAFQKNAHQAIETWHRRGWEAKSCESCHGPGSKHAESAGPADIRNPGKLSAAAVERGCLQCHANQLTQAGRIQSGHGRSQVSCLSCHDIHHDPPQPVQARSASAVNQQCAACHTSVWAEFQRPHKHKLPEGAMSCVDCHNPHGSSLKSLRRFAEANEPGCLKCHGDKRGPFTFEHAPVKMEGCATCHEPHGSSNPRMLTRHEVRFTCLECHANTPLPGNLTTPALGGVPPAFHDLRTPRYQNCNVCHVKIHGSQVDKELLR